MVFHRSNFAALCAALACLAGAAAATTATSSSSSGSSTSSSTSKTGEKPSARRGISWFHKPACATPETQWSHATNLYHTGHPIKAGRALQALVYAWPDTTNAMLAQLEYGRILMKRRKFESAIEEYTYALERYPDYLNDSADLTEEVWRNLYVAATNNDEEATYETALKYIPAKWHDTPDLRLRLAKTLEEDDDYTGARQEYLTILARYPGTPQAATAAFAACRCSASSCFDDTPRDEDNFITAYSMLAKFINQYPDGTNSARAVAMLEHVKRELEQFAWQRAYFYDHEDHPRNPQAALTAYREFRNRWPNSDRIKYVKSRIEALDRQIERK